MKKAFVLLLSLTLLCCVALAAISEGDVAAHVQAIGLDYSTADNSDGSIICDYSVSSSGTSEMQWSDAAHLYSVTGDTDTIAQLYVDALSLGGWESCRYLVGKKARISYGVKSKKVLGTLDEYLSEMESTLGVKANEGKAAPAASSDAQDYVLNTNTKKFHYPSCSSVGQMKAKNRQDYHGTRDELISSGYDPCGKCHP